MLIKTFILLGYTFSSFILKTNFLDFSIFILTNFSILNYFWELCFIFQQVTRSFPGLPQKNWSWSDELYWRLSHTKKLIGKSNIISLWKLFMKRKIVFFLINESNDKIFGKIWFLYHLFSLIFFPEKNWILSPKFCTRLFSRLKLLFIIFLLWLNCLIFFNV